MKFKIDTISAPITLKTGKTKRSANLTAENGATYESVTLWPDFPNYSVLVAGQDVEGDLKTTVNGQYTNHVLYPSPTGKPVYGKPRGNIAAAQEKKAEYIQHAQSNKEEGIKTSSTIRMATDVVVAMIGKNGDSIYSTEEVKQMIKTWRSWFISNWDLPNSPVGMDEAPF